MRTPEEEMADLREQIAQVQQERDTEQQRANAAQERERVVVDKLEAAEAALRAYGQQVQDVISNKIIECQQDSLHSAAAALTEVAESIAVLGGPPRDEPQP